jgi:hypothetical protein
MEVTMEIKGKFIGSELDRGFVYQYICPCGKKFTCTAPELSDPPLCHKCMTGGRRTNRGSDNHKNDIYNFGE